jgi:hypothetical protein
MFRGISIRHRKPEDSYPRLSMRTLQYAIAAITINNKNTPVMHLDSLLWNPFALGQVVIQAYCPLVHLETSETARVVKSRCQESVCLWGDSATPDHPTPDLGCSLPGSPATRRFVRMLHYECSSWFSMEPLRRKARCSFCCDSETERAQKDGARDSM